MTRSFVCRILKVVLSGHASRTLALTMAYGAVLGLSILAAYELRFDFDVPNWLSVTMFSVCTTTVAVQLLCLFVFGQFDGLLSYFSRPDLKRLVLACTSAAALLGAIRLIFGVQFAPPRGVILIHYVITIGALSAMRLSFRRIRLIGTVATGRAHGKPRRIGIFGAGDCGAALARELLAKPWLAMRPLVFFDDERDSHCSIHGIPIVGRPELMAEFKEKLTLDEIIIAVPSASAKRVRDIVRLCQEAGLPCRTVPSLDQLATGDCNVTNLRRIEIKDLLGREPVLIQGEIVGEVIEGRTVMVTGAGGSIGSELCRQILAYGPAALVFLDRSEPLLFVIEQELRAHHGATSLIPTVADVTRPSRMRRIFEEFRPQVVFHAAAHKHVPMMEEQPGEAIYNNVFGTALLADLAMEFAAERFVLISTDKAINPTNVMGATKRLAEKYVQSLTTRQSQTKFMAVRFGNVLGSSGSVVPIFERQIAAGGPVTVTHPEVTRFFMTISEAVSLVLQSSALGKGGDIFVLDMGKPVRIVDLALQMIALAGLTPHDDIEIAFTGLRPGEKLYEELSHGGESITGTAHPKIARLVSPPLDHNCGGVLVAELMAALDQMADREGLKTVFAKLLPDYTPYRPTLPLSASPLTGLPLPALMQPLVSR